MASQLVRICINHFHIFVNIIFVWFIDLCISLVFFVYIKYNFFYFFLILRFFVRLLPVCLVHSKREKKYN